MTLILTLGNSEQFIQLSDRRLSGGSRVFTDESNKAGLLTCANARLMFGYTGLAAIGSFRTHQWLLESLYKVGPPDYIALSILERLKDKASEDFKNHPMLRQVDRRNKRLSVMFSGYLDGTDPPLGACTILTNFQYFITGKDASEAWDTFECTYWQEKRPWEGKSSLIQRIGAYPAMTPHDTGILRTFLEEARPAQAIIGKAVEMLREMADRKTAGNTIGKQISVVCLPRDTTVPLSTSYHTNIVSHNIFFPSQIILTSDEDRLIAMNPVIMTTHPSQSRAIAVPKVGRNVPCPCGSGKKYKHCHGK